MGSKKPSDIEEYKAWLRTEHEVGNLEQLPTHYENVADEMRRAFERLRFWTDLKHTRLRDFDEEYRLAHAGYQLLVLSQA